MIQVSNNFKNEIKKLGKQIDFKLAIHTNDKIIAEDNNFLMTEDNRNLVVEQFNVNEIDEYITGEDIYNVAVVRQGKILSTLMKELDFEVTQDLRIGDTIDASFGLLVGNDYEWVDYGRFMIFSKEHNEDTNTYSYVAYDRMLLTMIPVKDRSSIENIEIGTAIDHICVETGLYSHVDWIYDNLYKYIAVDTFKDLDITYRDVLDMICQCLGINMVVENDTLYLKEINRTPVDTFDEEYLKDTNVKFGKKYGPINSVVLSRSEDNDNIYRRDETSIEENGLCEFKIKDNLIMLGEDREDYIDEIFNQLNGLEYYINDFTSTGITYLEQLDMFNIFIGDKLYPCLLLNDEIKVRQGLEETIYTEEPEETTTDYKTSSKSDKEVSFIVDKQRGNINAKVSKGDVINQINLDESGASIEAEKISLAGKEIKLTADDITIKSTNFNVDSNGNITANNATLNSGTFKGNINTSQDCIVGNNLYVGQNQQPNVFDTKGIYFSSANYIARRTSPIGDGMNLIAPSKIGFTVGGTQQMYINDGAVHIYPSDIQVADFGTQNIQFAWEPVISSDKRLKNNIKDIKDISWINNLKIKEYEYNNCKNIKRIGLIAQDYIGKDYSKYFLDKNENGYYGIRYNDITNALIQYCQEMKQEIEELKQEIKSLKGDDK